MLEVLTLTFLGAIAVFTGVIAMGVIGTIFVGIKVLNKPVEAPKILFAPGGIPGHDMGMHLPPGAEDPEGDKTDVPHGSYL